MTLSEARHADPPAVLETVSALRDFVSAERSQGRTIALVPTMGALHEGHLELVRQAFDHADTVIVSIFVNPKQFGPSEDLDAYPRTWDADIEKLAVEGAQAVFHPSVREMYPPGAATTVSVGNVSQPLEGACRPGHFDGVATVVSKLFLQCLPDVALFGEKDYQQLQVIRRMTADLDIPVHIVAVPVVRDENGLALSSRNAYLHETQCKVAAQLNETLFDMARRLKAGAPVQETLDAGKEKLRQAGFEKIDYLSLADAETLAPLDTMKTGARLLAAAYIGRTRLIDNIAAEED